MNVQMTVEQLLQTLSLVSFILAGVFLLISIALFFLFDIIRVVGDISGSTARKAIENIRQQNEESGDKAYKPSHVNMERGKVTDKISPSGRIQPQSNPLTVATGTSKLEHGDVQPTQQMPVSAETTVLNNTSAEQITASETTVLSDFNMNQNATSETTVLSDFSANEYQNAGAETTVLSGFNPNASAASFSVDYEIGFCGSSEIIG
ncbi:MAG: hypothetical protein IKW03_03040 [Clostridia bacterium]|nr:hypothetical protein [Clostridia bacterium]